MSAHPLSDAVACIEEARSRARLRGDELRARRLADLRDLVEAEADPERHLDDAVRPVRTRRYPPGAALGWLLRHDPHVRQMRRLHGLSIPDE